MSRIVPVAFTLFLFTTIAAAQTTTYTYTGDPYTSATAPYTLGGQLTGSFTVSSPLPAFLPMTSIAPSVSAFSFNDGVETRTLSSSFICNFQVATDGVGNITQWQIFLRRSPYNPGDPHHSIESNGAPGVQQGSDIVGTGNAPAGPCDPMVLSAGSASTGSQGS